jgi:hypothetical protein
VFLQVSGLIRGAIVRVSESLAKIEQDRSIYSLLQLALTPLKGSLIRRDRLEVLWRTLVGDSYSDSNTGYRKYPAPKETSRFFYEQILWQMAFKAYYALATRKTDEFMKKHEDYNSFALAVDIPSWQEIAELVNDIAAEVREANIGNGGIFYSKRHPEPRDFLLATGGLYRGRCLVMDESGNLGLGPSSTKKGDVVAFIRNARVPFILRKAQEGRYELVGEAYIHGFMHGEIAREGPVQLEEIILQ